MAGQFKAKVKAESSKNSLAPVAPYSILKDILAANFMSHSLYMSASTLLNRWHIIGSCTINNSELVWVFLHHNFLIACNIFVTETCQQERAVRLW